MRTILPDQSEIASAYDSNFRMTKQKVGTNHSIRFSYDKDGLLKKAGPFRYLRSSSVSRPRKIFICSAVSIGGTIAFWLFAKSIESPLPSPLQILWIIPYLAGVVASGNPHAPNEPIQWSSMVVMLFALSYVCASIWNLIRQKFIMNKPGDEVD